MRSATVFLPGDRAQAKILKQTERRERDLHDITREGKRPVVLVVVEAHDLHLHKRAPAA